MSVPAAVETLVALRDRGLKLALGTNGSTEGQRHKIERFDLARHFDAVLVEGEMGYGKPDERAYRDALRAIDARPEETTSVGDHLTWDVAAPQRLGMTGIWNDHAGVGLPADSDVIPDRVTRSVTELVT